MVEIVPAILPESLDDLRNHLVRVKGLVASVQIDIVDGVFAPSRTWPYTGGGKDELARIAREEEGLPLWDEFDFEIDMMVADPAKALEEWVRAGAAGVVFHIGSSADLSGLIVRAREMNMRAGIAARPSTPREEVHRYIDTCDFVQLMGNDHIGDHGVVLDEKIYGDIADLKKRFPDVTIAIDIGVNEHTAPRLIAAGATKLVAGSAIFGAVSAREAIEQLTGVNT